MNQLLLLGLLFFGTLSLSSCEKRDGARNASTIEGVGQGNGMNLYANSEMNIEFSYPSSWILIESVDKKKVRLEAPSGDQKNYIQFDYATQLNGQRFNNIGELFTYLKNQFPEKKWSKKGYGKAEAVYTIASDDTFELGEYHLIDKRGFILNIDYKFMKRISSEAIIRGIMSSVLIDEESPVVQRVWFEPSTVRPGEKIKLFIEVYDDLSGINLEKFGNIDPSGNRDLGNQFLNDYRRGLVGYSMPGHLDYILNNHTSHAYALGFNFIPLNKKFNYLKGNIYYYEIEIPKAASEGEILLNSLDVEDNFGNITRITVVEHIKNEGWVMNKTYQQYTKTVAGISEPHRSEFKLASAEIVASLDPNYIEDKLPPKLVDAYFSKVSIGKGESIDLFVRFTDDSKVRSDYPETSFNLNSGCWTNEIVWKEIEHNFFKTSLTIGCSATTNTVVYLSQLTASDEIGHISSTFLNVFDPSRADYFPKAIFYVRSERSDAINENEMNLNQTSSAKLVVQ